VYTLRTAQARSGRATPWNRWAFGLAPREARRLHVLWAGGGSNTVGARKAGKLDGNFSKHEIRSNFGRKRDASQNSNNGLSILEEAISIDYSRN